MSNASPEDKAAIDEVVARVSKALATPHKHDRAVIRSARTTLLDMADEAYETKLQYMENGSGRYIRYTTLDVVA